MQAEPHTFLLTNSDEKQITLTNLNQLAEPSLPMGGGFLIVVSVVTTQHDSARSDTPQNSKSNKILQARHQDARPPEPPLPPTNNIGDKAASQNSQDENLDLFWKMLTGYRVKNRMYLNYWENQADDSAPKSQDISVR